MKKKYMTPELTLVLFHHAHLLTTSIAGDTELEWGDGSSEEPR
jgi:hypothetical protein